MSEGRRRRRRWRRHERTLRLAGARRLLSRSCHSSEFLGHPYAAAGPCSPASRGKVPLLERPGHVLGYSDAPHSSASHQLLSAPSARRGRVRVWDDRCSAPPNLEIGDDRDGRWRRGAGDDRRHGSTAGCVRVDTHACRHCTRTWLVHARSNALILPPIYRDFTRSPPDFGVILSSSRLTHREHRGSGTLLGPGWIRPTHLHATLVLQLEHVCCECQPPRSLLGCCAIVLRSHTMPPRRRWGLRGVVTAVLTVATDSFQQE